MEVSDKNDSERDHYLNRLFQGPLSARISALYLEFAAVGLGLAVVVLSITGWWLVFTLLQQPMHPRLLAAVLLLQLLALPGAWLGVILLWRHARQLSALRPGQQQAPRVMAMLLATAADFGALVFSFSSLGVGLAVAIAGDQLALLSPGLAETLAAYSPLLQALGMLLLGLMMVLAGLSMAAAWLLALRFFADSIMLALQIADDTRAIRERMERGDAAPASEAPISTPPS